MEHMERVVPSMDVRFDEWEVEGDRVVGWARWTMRMPGADGAEVAVPGQSLYRLRPDGLVTFVADYVDPAAYAPLMKSLADQGIMSVIVPMPLDLAVFGVNRANDVLAAYPEIDHWIIGGHSLGGSMAAQYVKDNPTKMEGLAFLAAYPAANVDLSQLPIDVASIYGTLDGVAGDVFDESLSRLPAGTPLVVIEGGNHAQYGNYGPQAGDGVATISREEQQQQTTTAIGELANRLK